MEQRIGFCTASDNISIAYATLDGRGAAPASAPVNVIYVAGFPAHLEAEWERPTSRAFLETLATGALLIRYDMRGCGLSDATEADPAIDVLVRDLEAVAEATNLESFALLAMGMLAAPIAITYAAARPEKVTRMVLCSAYATGARLATPDQQHTLIDFTERFGFPVLQYAESPNPATDLDRTGRDVVYLAASPAYQAALLRAFYAADVSALLPRVTVPTTVLHGEHDTLVPFSEGRRLAAALPNAEFVPIGGNTGSALTEHQQTLPAVRRALGLPEIAGAKPGPAPPRASGTRTVLFTDIVNHTEMMARAGDERGRDLLREHDRVTRETLAAHGGVEVKATGDGFMASFGGTTAAVECAIALQRAFSEAPSVKPTGSNIQIRVGINAGEPIEEDGDLFGAMVILAARIAAQAGAGDILIPEPVRHLLAGKSFTFVDRGAFVPKGFDDAVRLYEVRWQR